MRLKSNVKKIYDGDGEDEKDGFMKMLFMQKYLLYYIQYAENNKLVKFSRDSVIDFYIHLQSSNNNEDDVRTFIEGKLNEEYPEIYVLDMEHMVNILLELWEKPSNMKNIDNIFIGMPKQEVDVASELKLIRNMRYLRDIYSVEKYFNFREPGYENVVEKNLWEKLCSQQHLIGINSDCKYFRIPLKDFHPPTREQIELFLEEISEGCETGCSMSAGHCVGGNGRTGAFILAILKCKYDINSSDELLELLNTKYTSTSHDEIKYLLSIPENKEWHEYVKYLFDNLLTNESCVKIKKYNIDNM